MLPEFGQFALIIALFFALSQSIASLWASWRGNVIVMRLSRPFSYGQFFFVAMAFVILGVSLYNNDFSVLYVAENSNLQLPWIYRICAIWGGHEGSLLLWVFILSVWMFAFSLFSRKLSLETSSRVLAILGLISVGFLTFMLFTSSPFIRILPHAPLNGRDLNPLLQDPGLISHPPMLYMGYVGFSVAFAFAIAALLKGRLDSVWVRWSRPWTLVAWSFLTVGIVLGSWWSYRELGWGGWWFWDPVENASFMPWLAGTALIHCLIVAEKRNTFKSWTVLMAIIAFSLSLIGTFLVRSGVLISVHAFAVDPQRGMFILVFLSLVIIASLILYIWRGGNIKSMGTFGLWSRETMLLSNNMLLATILMTVFLGTIYPIIVQTMGMGKISVGAPYFNTLFKPLMVPVLFFMGIAPHVKWKKSGFKSDSAKTWYLLVIATACAIAFQYLYAQHLRVWLTIGLSLALWVIMSTVKFAFKKRGYTMSTVGMILAHIGLAVCAIGIMVSKSYSTQRNVYMHTGDNTTLGRYQVNFGKVSYFSGPNYQAAQARLMVFKDHKRVDVLRPELRIYDQNQQLIKKTAIDAGFFRDIYVGIGQPVKRLGWPVQIYDKPFIRWIWLGGLLIALGGFLAAFDRRYRPKSKKKALT